MHIPLVDLERQYLAHAPELDKAIRDVLQATAFIGGPFVTRFEEEWASYCGAAHAVGTGNGTDALYLALRASGIGPGDEVLTVPNTFIATAEAIELCGAMVRFVDCEPGYHTMDPSLLEAAITPATKALLPVHLYGQPVDMPSLMAVAERYGLTVIEDCAQAHGATIDGRRVGTIGKAGCFSFYPGKNLGAYGDAGALVSDDAGLAGKAAMVRDHGRAKGKKYEHELSGFNFRLDGLQASILLAKLRHLPAWTERRRERVSLYRRLLGSVPDLTLPLERPNALHVYHLLVVEVEKRDVILEQLTAKGIGCGIHYPIPLHLQPAFQHLGYREGDFPVAEATSKHILSLPLFPELEDAEIAYVVDALTAALAGA
ncbi:MAG: erythromycin biosynthesis sensory transduction protein eryC1 [Deltaproteobacteria bacterium RIFOXYA12_FULL_61_11]|nr:MAG: erythromycin biosynthesis sensory transduction protein eryC1 [Deltaproteobacteria bacterium RIFOXYA12_FULL_61_11]